MLLYPMKKLHKPIVTIDDYISLQENSKKISLEKIRAIIKKVAPKATECISYQMPAFKQENVLVYFAVAKNHFGFYPSSKPIEVFKKQLDEKGYAYSKGAIQFPLDKPIPVKLIQEIVKYRLKENELKNLAKKISNKKIK